MSTAIHPKICCESCFEDLSTTTQVFPWIPSEITLKISSKNPNFSDNSTQNFYKFFFNVSPRIRSDILQTFYFKNATENSSKKSSQKFTEYWYLADFFQKFFQKFLRGSPTNPTKNPFFCQRFLQKRLWHVFFF